MMDFSGPESDRIRQLEEQMARLQAEIASLRASRSGQRTWVNGPHRAGRGASRRALLRWGGAAAAAAAVTLVTSEQSAHAAAALPADNGGAVIIGQTNNETSATGLFFNVPFPSNLGQTVLGAMGTMTSAATESKARAA